jgi:hypothetical protein
MDRPGWAVRSDFKCYVVHLFTNVALIEMAVEGTSLVSHFKVQFVPLSEAKSEISWQA